MIQELNVAEIEMIDGAKDDPKPVEVTADLTVVVEYVLGVIDGMIDVWTDGK